MRRCCPFPLWRVIEIIDIKFVCRLVCICKHIYLSLFFFFASSPLHSFGFFTYTHMNFFLSGAPVRWGPIWKFHSNAHRSALPTRKSSGRITLSNTSVYAWGAPGAGPANNMMPYPIQWQNQPGPWVGFMRGATNMQQHFQLQHICNVYPDQINGY